MGRNDTKEASKQQLMDNLVTGVTICCFKPKIRRLDSFLVFSFSVSVFLYSSVVAKISLIDRGVVRSSRIGAILVS